MIWTAATFIHADPEGGRRGQALVAAAFDMVFDNVEAGRINDPSRNYPGDVKVHAVSEIVLSVEVRQKVVRDDGVRFFVEESCGGRRVASCRRGAGTAPA